jgi:prepilin-type N-terminal cleavage/methylation domain-containing protein
MARKAFTLLEILLTMAVIAVVLALSYPTLDAMYAGFKMQGATDTVRAAWAEARSHAMNEGRPYRFSIYPGKGNFRVAPDSSDFWAGNNAPASANDPANPALVVEDAVPDGVRLSLPNNGGGDAGGPTAAPPGSIDPSSWVTTVVFLPDGTCRDDAEVMFQIPGARPVSIKLRGLTGTIRP